MTIGTSLAKAGPYNGNDSTTVFAYAFPIAASSELEVIKTNTAAVESTLTLDVDYTVSGVGDAGGGNVTYPISGSPLATGEKLTIRRSLDFLQSVDFTNQGTTYKETFEAVADKLTKMSQYLLEEVGRAARVSISSGTDPDTLITDAAASATAAAASATAAASSATAAAASATAASASETAAAASETAAAASETAAGTSETNAASSASAASTSASNASTSETNAASSASAASTSASNASTSETNAASSATAAAASATAAAASAAAAAQDLWIGGTESGTGNAYVVPITSGPGSLVDGVTVLWKAPRANTGAVTLNFDGNGAVAVQRQDSALVSGDIEANAQILVRYDGTVWQLINEPRRNSVRSLVVGSATGGNQGASTVNATTYYADGAQVFPIIAKGVFNGQTGASISASGVSMTRVSEGLYEFTLDTAAPDTNYVPMLTIMAASADERMYHGLTADFAMTTTKFRVKTWKSTGSIVDVDELYIAVLY